MAKSGISEFAGTEPVFGNGSGGPAGATGSGPIDPATLGGGSGTSDSDAGSDDAFERDATGAIIRNRDGSPRRKRGRKGGGNSGSGGGNAKPRAARQASSKDDLKQSVDNLTGMLMIAHVTLAGVTNTPELELSEEESKTLAKGIVPVLDQFDFVPDPKIAAVIGLIAASAKVYGPRAYLISARLKAEKEAAREKAMRNVTPGAADVFGMPN